MNRRAFTLLEVLFAVVLLSLVVSVCIPYMRSSPQSLDPGKFSAFAAAIDEELYILRLEQQAAPTIDQIREAISGVGVRCEPASEVDIEIMGRWVAITDGDHTVLRWASVRESDLSDDHLRQRGTP